MYYGHGNYTLLLLPHSTTAVLFQGFLRRSEHYWEILVDILAERDKYRDTPKYCSPKTSQSKGSLEKVLLTPKSQGDRTSLLNEARISLANMALSRADTSRALSLYSRVKTAHAAWNQAQVRHHFCTCMCALSN